MAIDFKTFSVVAPYVITGEQDSKIYPIMLRGRHGIGKSQVVYQTAEKLAWDGKRIVVRDDKSDLPGYRVIERRASQMTEGDLIGLPKTDGDVTSFCPPDWFQFACDNPCVLFLDEVDRATPEVRQGIFQLTDSRTLNGNRLHSGTVVCAAINGGEHGEQYQVGEMDPAEIDRWTVYDVEPTVEDWLDWAKDRVAVTVWDFVNNNRNHLEHTTDFEPNKVYPSRRSWDRLSTVLNRTKLLDDGASATLFNLSSGFVGFEAAVAFNDYVENYAKVVTPEDILDKGEHKRVKDFGINDHSALVEKMQANECFKEELSEEQIKNLATYFVALPSEVAMKLWTVLGEGEMANTIKLHKCQVDGRAVSSHLVELLTGDNPDDKKEEEK